jgi:hypothetical protein
MKVTVKEGATHRLKVEREPNGLDHGCICQERYYTLAENGEGAHWVISWMQL